MQQQQRRQVVLQRCSTRPHVLTAPCSRGRRSARRAAASAAAASAAAACRGSAGGAGLSSTSPFHSSRCPLHGSSSDRSSSSWWRRNRRSPVAAAAAAAVPAALASSSLLDMAAVAAASAASFKLLFLCGGVALMSHRHMIPPNTSQVMSQVAFAVTIPAMLLASTTKTLVATAAPASLVGIPAVAFLQIALGAVLGRAAAAAVDGRLPLTRLLLGWHHLHPTQSAMAIAASTAAALRAPAAAPALLPVSSGIPPSLPLLVELCCAFGNTVTLPLLYLLTMLPAGDASRAAGFMSLFHAAWSPCLWVFGFSRVQEASRAARQPGGRPQRPSAGILSRLAVLWRQLVAAARDSSSSSSSGTAVPSSGSSSSSGGFSPPSGQPAVLITRQLPSSSSSGAGGPSGWGSSGRAVYAVQSSSEEDEPEPETTPAERLARRLLRVARVLGRTEVAQKLGKAINPPVTAVFAGLALGLSPAGPLLSDKAAAAAFVAAHSGSSPFVAAELTLLLGVLRCCWETVELLASGTLALQALVLAASLFGSPQFGSSSGSGGMAAGDADDAAGGALGGSPQAGASGDSSNSGSGAARGTVELVSPGGGGSDLDQPLVLAGPTSSSLSLTSSSSSASGAAVSGIRVQRLPARTPDDAGASVLRQLLPRSSWEWRALAAVAAVRFLLLPAASAGLVLAAMRSALLPADPACIFMLLLQSCMPPAQNLVLMMQLQPGTAPLAPATARLLLQLYTLAILPVTLWVSVFARLAGLS